MVQPGVREVVFIAVGFYKFIHECHRGRLVVECAQVHDLDALSLVDGQKFRGAESSFFFRVASATAQSKSALVTKSGILITLIQLNVDLSE